MWIEKKNQRIFKRTSLSVFAYTFRRNYSWNMHTRKIRAHIQRLIRKIYTYAEFISDKFIHKIYTPQNSYAHSDRFIRKIYTHEGFVYTFRQIHTWNIHTAEFVCTFRPIHTQNIHTHMEDLYIHSEKFIHEIYTPQNLCAHSGKFIRKIYTRRSLKCIWVCYVLPIHQISKRGNQ